MKNVHFSAMVARYDVTYFWLCAKSCVHAKVVGATSSEGLLVNFDVLIKHILQLVSYYKKETLPQHNQHFTLTFHSLSETFIRRSSSSSSSDS